MPARAWKGASAARHAASRVASGVGLRWQKKLRLNGRAVAARWALQLGGQLLVRQHRRQQCAQPAGL